LSRAEGNLGNVGEEEEPDVELLHPFTQEMDKLFSIGVLIKE